MSVLTLEFRANLFPPVLVPFTAHRRSRHAGVGCVCICTCVFHTCLATWSCRIGIIVWPEWALSHNRLRGCITNYKQYTQLQSVLRSAAPSASCCMCLVLGIYPEMFGAVSYSTLLDFKCAYSIIVGLDDWVDNHFMNQLCRMWGWSALQCLPDLSCVERFFLPSRRPRR